MSLDAMLAVIKLAAFQEACGVELTTNELWLLAVIAESAGEDGDLSHYTRSQDFLCWKCGWSDTRTVRKVLRRLVAKGLLEIERGRGGDTSRYRLTFLDRVPAGNIAKLYWDERKRTTPTRTTGPTGPLPTGPTGPVATGPSGPVATGPTGPVHIKTSTSSPLLSTSNTCEERLAHWFEARFWPAYPHKIDKLGAWRELRAIAPDAQLRTGMLEAIAALVDEHEHQASTNEDGFAPAYPTAKNWLRDRRWLDDYGRARAG